MTSRIFEGLTVEGRVLLALMLREIHTINGSSRLGYLWVLIQSAFGEVHEHGLSKFQIPRRRGKRCRHVVLRDIEVFRYRARRLMLQAAGRGASDQHQRKSQDRRRHPNRFHRHAKVLLKFRICRTKRTHSGSFG